MAIHLVAGMARGGTNLIWTALASAENFYITRQEVNELLSTKNLSLYQKLLLESTCLPSWYFKSLSQVSALHSIRTQSLESTIIDSIQRELDLWLSLNYSEPPPLKMVDVLSPTSTTVVGLKMVSSWPGSLVYGLLQRNNPLKYIHFLSKLLSVQHISIVVRHPLAQAEAWMRRGASESLSFQYYNQYIDYFMSLPATMPHIRFSFVTLDRFLANPINSAYCLSKNICSTANSITAIRVAKQPTINNKYVNTTDKVSQLFDESNLQNGIQRDIEQQHIDRFQGNRCSSLALESKEKYELFSMHQYSI